MYIELLNNQYFTDKFILLSSLPVPTMLINSEGTVIDTNQGASNILKKNHLEFLRNRELTHTSYLDAVKNVISSLRHGNMLTNEDLFFINDKNRCIAITFCANMLDGEKDLFVFQLVRVTQVEQ